jgi:hypothetical protein
MRIASVVKRLRARMFRVRRNQETTNGDDRSSIVDAFCARCGLDRSDDPELTNMTRPPCSGCGATAIEFRRTMTATVTTSSTVSSALQPGVQSRGWRLRWQLLEARVVDVTASRSEPRRAEAIHAAAQDLFEFFVSAYHLKDSVIADGAVTKKTVEGVITASPTLALLADLANLDKHRKLTKPPRSGSVPTVEGISDTSTGDHWDLIVTIRHADKEINGCTFATSAMDAWRKELTGWKLL